MARLEDIGIPGREHLREALTSCSDPLAAIEEFQDQNGILLPSLRPALPFLDLHSVSRLEFHSSVMDELSQRLLSRVSELAVAGKEPVLEELLGKSFAGIKIPALKPVVLAIMKHVTSIKPEYLKTVLEDSELYRESDVQVKQQIWLDHQELFASETSPLFDRYTRDKEEALVSVEAPMYFTVTTKVRRQSYVVQTLASMVGGRPRLYSTLVQFLRTMFLRSRCPHYSSLRAELLMALHDLEVHQVTSSDPCHKFTWCLHACVRERQIDAKRAKELQGFLDNLRKGQDKVIGDIAMVLLEPYALHTVCTSLMRALQRCATQETLPRGDEEIILLLRLLSLALEAWQMIDSEVYKEPKLEASVVTKFLPSVIGLFVDDQLRNLGAKTKEDNPKELWSLGRTIIDNPLTTLILLHYVIHNLRDTAAISRILPVLLRGDLDTVFEDTALHVLVSGLATGQADSFINPQFCDVVFDSFLLKAVSRENVVHHTLRLLWFVHHRIPKPRMTELLDKLQPNNEHSASIKALYQSLLDKISSYKPSPVAEPMALDSPLMSVPAPTPAR